MGQSRPHTVPGRPPAHTAVLAQSLSRPVLRDARTHSKVSYHHWSFSSLRLNLLYCNPKNRKRNWVRQLFPSLSSPQPEHQARILRLLAFISGASVEFGSLPPPVLQPVSPFLSTHVRHPWVPSSQPLTELTRTLMGDALPSPTCGRAAGPSKSELV